jgi:hypothetical protein
MGGGDGVSDVDGSAFARLFRSRCNVCGSERLTWGSVGEVGGLLDAGQDSNDWLSEVAQGLGMHVGPGLMALSAWRCDECGELGVFGPVEVGP